MGIASLPAFVAGARIEPASDAARITSLDGAVALPVTETGAVQLRRALRHAEQAQARVRAIPVADRVADARRLLHAYAQRADDAAWALAHFRGLVARDTRWMCEVNLQWAEGFETLLEVMTGSPGMIREVASGATRLGALGFRSKGRACLYSSSTMDGPAAVVALCHAMLSGTHLILRPSFRDAATHLAFEALEELGLAHYAQLVRYRSEAPDAPLLNRQLLGNVSQAIVFSATESFRALLDQTALPGTSESDALRTRVQRYGTGLPLAVVTEDADLDRAARDLVEGARLGGGRFCLSAGPVLVARSRQEALCERIVAEASRLRAGPPLDDASELSSHDPATTPAMRAAVQGFGGVVAYGAIREHDMDVLVLRDVPSDSPALHREIPGPVLALIPADHLEEMSTIAGAALRRNHRQAWTALVSFASPDDHLRIEGSIESFRYLRGGVVSRVKLLLPHQGSYFALDLMRRVSLE